MPKAIVIRLRSAFPARQRSIIITHLVSQELERRENELFACAQAVNSDAALNKEMSEWDTTLNDGLEDESW